MSKLFGCTLTSFTNGQALIDWIKGEGSALAEAAHTQWLLAHCDDGVVWGRYEQGEWKLSSNPFPHISPQLTSDNLQQLRLFGSQHEVLIWRGENGFQGRILTDADKPVAEELLPKQERQILIGDRLLEGPHDGFSLVGDAGGSRHAVPVHCNEEDFEERERPDWPLRLVVKHYLTQDQDSGMVRIAASRLIDVYNSKKK